MRFSSLLPSFSYSKDPVNMLHHNINQLFENVLKQEQDLSSVFTNSESFIRPRIDISETEQEYTLIAELPGVEKEDVTLELQGNVLTIKGRKHLDRTEKDKNYYMVERAAGNFSRYIELPQLIEQDQVQASFKNGLLTITLPKSKESKVKTRKITIG